MVKAQQDCHALALVIFVFFIILVRSVCDMDDYMFLSCLGLLYVYGVVTSLGVLYVYGCLDWFSIRGSSLLLSLIGNHI